MDLELGGSGPSTLQNGRSTEQSGLANAVHVRTDEKQKRSGGAWGDVNLAYRTLGVVFGGLVTSPLYVYPSMNLSSPTEDDYLGIYSIIFWTLTLIGVVKYVCIALKADDHGEGGTFAMYSLLCRHVDIGILPSKKLNSIDDRPHNHEPGKLGKFLERSIVARRVLLFVAVLGMCMLIGDGILTPAISGFACCIRFNAAYADPMIPNFQKYLSRKYFFAGSVLSAIDGLRGPFPSVGKSAVQGLSAAILIALFLLQKYGTCRVSFLFSPIMASWTFTTPIIGVYSIIHYNPGILKTVSPHYVLQFFLRNKRKGWQLLGGTVLCITGAEAMFADLGHFNQRSIQLAFLFSIYPSLVLTYAGQTAYLMKNPNDHNDGFYKFVPGPVYWPMFIIATLAAIVASQSLISATFSVIKQSVALDYFPRVKVVHTSQDKEGEVYSPETNYILMFLCVAVVVSFGDGKDIGNAFGVVVILVMLITTILLTLVMIIIWRTPLPLAGLYFVCFFVLEGSYVSAVVTKIIQGGWFPFAVSTILASIMFAWYYGRQKKIEYETTNKITLECLAELLSSSDTRRVPGLSFFYSNTHDGLTPILRHYIKSTHSLHKVTIFTTLRYLLVPKVAPKERILVTRFGVNGVYGCIIQYGYADKLNSQGEDFVIQVMNTLRAYIEKNARDQSSGCVEAEVSQLEEAKAAGVVHVRGKTRFHVGKESGWFDRILIGYYEFLHNNCRSALPTLGVPLHQRMEIGMLYKA